MNKADPPRTFGVFKPAGHTLLVFPEVQQLDEATRQRTAAGIVSGDLIHYTPQEMMAQTEDDLAGASALASIGQDLNLIKVHRELALKGCHFLVVPTGKDEIARQVVAIVQPLGAIAAQHYGSLVVEDLIADGTNQVFESPDRGLDTDLPIPPTAN